VAPRGKNILNQSPLESGLCGTCHLVHNARGVFLWARETTNNNDATEQALCLGCHNEGGLAKNKVIRDFSHPIHISPFEKGMTTTLPLFDTNGQTSNGGVIGCSTCHDPHRWEALKTASGDHFDIEGDSQNSFLRLENSPAPKLCGNCHPTKAYIEKTDHDLTVSAPDARNILGQTPRESGVCGVCHIVHNSQHKIQLWAQGFGMGNNIMELMCNSCHSENGSAKNKIPQAYLHPREKLVDNTDKNIKGRPDFFPLFHAGSGERVTKGNISCPSCHTAHQWDPEIPDRGEGVNPEGSLTNSFLRPQTSRQICADCHKKDARLKFKYYHDADKRKFKGINDLFFQ
jgi:predicted CXXCH cytochrome family protein